MNLNVMDGKAHVFTLVEIDQIKQISNESEDVRVDVTFVGGELSLNVPKSFIFDPRGVPMFKVGDNAFVEYILGIKSVNKTFGDRSYSALDPKIKRVVNFRKLTAEESKAL